MAKPLPYQEVRRKLLAAGFIELGTEGSHVKFVKRRGHWTWVAIVPKHGQVAPGTIRSIMRQAHLTQEEFDRL